MCGMGVIAGVPGLEAMGVGGLRDSVADNAGDGGTGIATRGEGEMIELPLDGSFSGDKRARLSGE